MTTAYADSLQTLKQAKTNHQVFRIAEHTLYFFPWLQDLQRVTNETKDEASSTWQSPQTSLENCQVYKTDKGLKITALILLTSCGSRWLRMVFSKNQNEQGWH